MIRRRGASALLPALLAALVLAAPAAGAAAPAAPAGLAYRIDARLDPEARTVTAHLHARWVHPGGAPVDALWLHLYLNAFDSNRTTLMTELRLDSWLERHPDGWGRIDLAALRVDGRDRLAALEYVQPDDGNPADRTLARLPLARPVAAREAVELDIDFVASLPRVLLRSGHAAPFFSVTQWFPKLAAFRGGAWRAHQYHAASEFFADFATWDVSLTVPSAYVVGHTGVATATRDNGDGSKTIDVHAEAVHDFAWVADPRFEVIEETIAGVPVRLLVQPHHRAQAGRYLDAVRVGLERYAEWIEPYPYPVLTVVDPGPGARGAGGMEYPMLITVGTARWLPAGVRLPEVVTIHELGHQWWYGVVANDEVEEPWLDEGINRYVEGRIMDATYGPGSYCDWLGFEVDAAAVDRWSYLEHGRWDPITTTSFRMLDRDSYIATAYAKTALALATVAGLFGADPLLDALGEYARQWRFRQPTGADFRASLAASLGEEVTPVLDQLLDGTGTLDYAVARVDVRRVPTPAPVAGAQPARREPARFRSEIVVERRGEVRLPVDILVAYDDGSRTRETWDGESRWYRIDAVSTRQASYAVVDPDHKLPLDANWLNNSRLADPGSRDIWRLAARWGIWLQSALMGLSGL